MAHVSRDDPAVDIRNPRRPMEVHGPGRPTGATQELGRVRPPTTDSGEGSEGRSGLWTRSSFDKREKSLE